MINYLNRKFTEHLADKQIISKEQKDWFVQAGLFVLHDIPLRALISEIQNLKAEGKLHGGTPEEEHQYFVETYLSDQVYRDDFYSRYPEIARLSEQVVRQTVALYSEICMRQERDRTQITEKLCKGKKFHGIAALELSASDPHNSGKRTARVTLDNGTVLYYKPHTVRKNQIYQEIYHCLCREAGLSCEEIFCIDCGKYGWEAQVQSSACETETQVNRYYVRMGIHLFLGYLLSVSDLHAENIIASGEYPVIVDFETYPGVSALGLDPGGQTVEAYIRDSVIKTGILPCLSWGQGKNAAIISAINRPGKIRTPFRMPVVKNSGRSDIHIAHEMIEMEIPECTVRLRSREMDPSAYTEALCRGFTVAYRACLADEELLKMVIPFFDGRSRVVLRHTQQYAMYRFTSLHQDFCKDGKRRRQLLFSVLHTQEEDVIKRTIHDYETESLLRLDIPYFEIDASGTSLYDGDGNEYPDYLPISPLEAWKNKRKLLSEEDLERQLSVIRLSMALIAKERSFPVPVDRRVLPESDLTKQMESHIQKIAKWLCETMVATQSKAGWISIRYFNHEKWCIAPAGKYLYDGIAGPAVFLAAYLRQFQDDRAKTAFDLVKQTMFDHTDRMMQENEGHFLYHEKGIDCERASGGQTGVLEGEGSIVSTYLMLYRITGGQEYLSYAQRHFRYIEQMYRYTSSCDYLSGNAGAVVTALRLYERTGQKRYLELAIRIEETIWEKVRWMEQGCGWCCEGEEIPLTGMAHGSSGVLMAYSALLKHTQEQHYRDKIFDILAYENSLYSEEDGNWLDLRKNASCRAMNAWCHGAPGILLSRMELAAVIGEETVRKDIERAANALFTQNTGEHICLCHGIAGNLLIMNQYLKVSRQPEYERKYQQRLSDFLLNLEAYGKQVAFEYCQPGFMNGITGVGYALLQLYS